MTDKRIGIEVLDLEKNSYKLVRQVGFGAQGTVYEDETGEWIIKLLHKHNAVQTDEMVRRYSWICRQQLPKELVKPYSLLAPPYVGYVMKKVRGHEPLSRYISQPKGSSLSTWYNQETGGLRKRLYLGAMMANAFSKIHLAGLAYCDISPTNILIGKKRMSVCLIDPDNLSASGKAESLVMGTPRYIAPELLNRLFQPNPLSDVYSYAVILFEMLCLGHPLLGDSVHEADPEEEERALAGLYPYIGHPEDDSNRSSRILPPNMMLTQRLRELFEQMFVAGLHNRMKRPSLRDFYLACMEGAEIAVECQSCKATYYFDKIHRETKCIWCNAVQPMESHMKFIQYIGKPADIPAGPLKKEQGILVLRPGSNVLSKRHFYSGFGNERLGILEYTPPRTLKFLNQSGGKMFFISGKSKKQETIIPGEIAEITEVDLLFAEQYTVKEGYPGTKMVMYTQFVRGG